MAVIRKPNKVIFENDKLDHTLVSTFMYDMAEALPKAQRSTVENCLRTCDHFNSGIYENTYPKEVTKVTLTYYTRSEKTEVEIQYGEFDGQILGRGCMDGILYDEHTLYGVKERIEYFLTYDRKNFKRINGYKILFTLRQAK